MDGILRLWLYEVPEYTKQFCILMIVTNLTEQLTYFLQNSVSAQGEVRGYSIWKSICNSLSIPLTIILFEFYDKPEIAIIVRLVTFVILGNIVNIVYSRMKFGLSYKSFLTRVIVPCFITACASSLLCLLLRSESTQPLTVVMHMMLILVLSLPLYYITALDSAEKNFVNSTLKRLYKNEC